MQSGEAHTISGIKGTQYGTANMEMIEQSQPIFGLIANIGSQETFATMEIKTAITNLHREGVRQERRGEKVVMRDLKYHENYVWKYSVVLAGNGSRLVAVRIN